MENKILKRYPLGNPHRIWKQDNYILSNFSAKGDDMRKVIRNCAEAGFNLLELGWASPEQAEQAVIYCEQLGVDLIYQELKRYGGMQGNRFYEKNDLEGVINDHRKWKCIKGYYIWDEPLLDDQIDEARVLTDICQREAPELIPFTVAIPSYNAEYTWGNGKFPEYLEKYVTRIDPPVLSLDYYPVGMGEHNATVQFDRSRMWCDLGLMKKLGEKYNMPILYSCHPRSKKRLEQSGFVLDKRVICQQPLGFNDYNNLQMNAFAVVSDSGTLPEESSYFTSIGKPFPAVCIRTSTERPEALDKACFVLAGIDEKSLLQAVETAVKLNENCQTGLPVPDYTDLNVSTKVVKLIQSYTGVVDKMVWRKF